MTELERALRQQRRINVFWLCVTLGDLGYCVWSVFAFAPHVAYSVRGGALVLLSVGYATWMIWTNLYSWQARRCRPYLAPAVWLVTFALTLVLFALSPLMGWLCYPVFGMAFAMFDLAWAIPAALAAYVLIPITILLNGYAPLSAARDLTFWGGFALAFPIYAAMCYVPAKSMRERIRREANMAEMERMHRELEAAHAQLAASAEHERELAVLRERGRLARDMHDTLGHTLVLATVKLEAARRLRAVDAQRADHELDATQQILRDAMSELRATLAALRMPIAPDEGIGEVLGRAAREAGQRAGWQVTCDVASDPGPLDERTREALLRIGLEALTNAERHAHAHHVALALARDADERAVTLRVTDDGVGLDVYVAANGASGANEVTGSIADGATSGQSPAGHYGVTGMRERAAALGGSVQVYSPPAGGTVVLARLPLHQDAAAAEPAHIQPDQVAAASIQQ